MKYPVIYVKNLMGVHKHSSVSYALHLRIVSDEAEDEQRAAYQKKVLTQMYHMVENQFVVAQSKIVENDGDQTYDILYYILIKQNGDIHGDWDGKILDVEKYRNVTFEPYDLRWIETC